MTDETDPQHAAPPVPWFTRLNLSEPVRLRLYATTATLIAVAVGYGLLDNNLAGLWLAVAAAALGTGVTEATRRATVAPLTTARAIRVAADQVSIGNSVPGAVALAASETGQLTEPIFRAA